MAPPPHLSPFVVPIETRAAERHDAVDLYFPDDLDEPRPAVVFVHGLLMSPEPLTTRDWPIFQGYGSLTAARGAVGVTLDHRLYGPADYPPAADDLAAAVASVRADPRVDADRVALWFFSSAALLLADWLRTPPDWLGCVAATYPVLAAPPEWGVDPRFQPVEAVAEAGSLPIVLTRVGRERPPLAATVAEFVAAAHACDARLEIIDVPEGQHGFDTLDHTDESRKAVEQALNAVLNAVR